MKHKIPTPLEFVKNDFKNLGDAINHLREESLLATIVLICIALAAFLWAIQ